jgi:formylglycine-generating enzyme required for sulfatase activity
MRTSLAPACVVAAAVALCVSGCGEAGAKPLAVPEGVKTLTLELAEGVEMKLVRIPAGEFMMGSKLSPAEVTKKCGGDEGWYKDEHPRHKVRITRPFHMGQTHVTVDQFAAFVKDSGYKTDAEKDGWSVVFEIRDGKADLKKGDGASWRKPGFDQTGDHPVVHISWNDAKAFCDWLSKRSGKTVRLPTEAEWEYACRAGTTTAYPWGDKPDDGKGWANGADQSLRKAMHKSELPAERFFRWDDGVVFTSPAGRFKPNALGLYDMVGNAWQWCGDWYGAYEKGAATNPTGPKSGKGRVLRGGGWNGSATYCRSADRYGLNPTSRGGNNGFRVVLRGGVD